MRAAARRCLVKMLAKQARGFRKESDDDVPLEELRGKPDEIEVPEADPAAADEDDRPLAQLRRPDPAAADDGDQPLASLRRGGAAGGGGRLAGALAAAACSAFLFSFPLPLSLIFLLI